MNILNPSLGTSYELDARSREIVEKTVAFFEAKGRKRLRADDLDRVWYRDFLDFIDAESAFADLLTPPAYGGPESRWDTYRNAAFNEVLGFYGLCYWYAWQVSILGLGPVWMSPNEEQKRHAAVRLKEGGIFAFALSEREHGADIYATGMTLTPQEDGTFRANGSKYYIGNANEAALVSVFGKIPGAAGTVGSVDTAGTADEYVFFATDPKQPGYELLGNVVASQSYVGAFNLNDTPVAADAILMRGKDAWDAALNTVNIGKYNLGWASIGMCAHAFHEALNHAVARRLYNMSVTDFPHVKQMFTDAWARLVAMKLFALRASDYLRSASPEDRRYLLYNPVMKMKVTTEGEKVIDLLWDVIAAKGFEKDGYFEMAARDIRALPKLEGTVHVNIALIVKFMANYFFAPAGYADVPRRTDATHDEFLFRQGPASGLGTVRFHDFAPVYARFGELSNVALFREQITAFRTLLATASPSDAQAKDIDFLLALGELFTLVVYGQLVLENAELMTVDHDTVDQIFDFMVRDFSRYALQLHAKPSSTPRQMELCLGAIRKPAVQDERSRRVWKEKVLPLHGTYRMNE
ncbi:MAG: acyl-CoA dehydrogenase [Thermoanaerobaculia bacterium]